MGGNSKILGIIPARGGSKGIPYKNIISVCGKPLIAYTIESSLKSKYITRTVVSSEDEKILKIASDFGANIIRRPKKLSTDKATSESVIQDALKQLKSKGEEFDLIILLQPTSPLRDESDIDNSVEYFLKSDATALISAYEPLHHPYKSFKVNNKGFLEGIINNEYPFKIRQNLPIVYNANGAIYIIYVKNFIQKNKLFTEKTIPYIMPIDKSVDIDSINDLRLVENLIKRT